MAVRIERGSATRLRRSPTGFVVLADATAGDQPAAVRALARARTRLLGVDVPDGDLGVDPRQDANGVAYVSDVSATPRGALLYVDGGSLPAEHLLPLLEWVVAALQAEGVSDAVVSVPDGASDLDPAWRQTPGPCLTLTRQKEWFFQSEAPPAGWTAIASRWLTGDADVLGAGLHLLVPGVDVPVRSEALREVLGLSDQRAVGLRHVVAGDPATGFRFVACLRTALCSLLTLGASGPAVGDPEQRAAELTGIAAEAADTATYGFLELGALDPLAERRVERGRPARADCLRVLDEVVLDAFPFQLLGPGHLARLGGPPSGAHRLADGRVSWRVGELADWADPVRADELRRLGRSVLAPLLPTEDELHALDGTRMQVQFAERKRRAG